MKRRMRWSLFIIANLLVLIALAALLALRVAAVQDALFQAAARRAFEHRVRGIDALLRDDALRAGVCGSSSPVPDPRRAKSCIAVIAGGRLYLVDTGPKSAGATWLPLHRLTAVFLTHFHSDHIGDLGELNSNSWALGRTMPLDVYGPPGVERIVGGFSEAYALDQKYRTAFYGAGFASPLTWQMIAHPVKLVGASNSSRDRIGVAFDDGKLKVTAIEVNHLPVEPAYGYRFDYKGRSLVISGDTVCHPPLARAARGADVLFHEAQSEHVIKVIEMTSTHQGDVRLSKNLRGVQRLHTSPREAARIANDGQTKVLVFYHLTGVLNLVGELVSMRGVKAVRPTGWLTPHDGTVIELPLNSNRIDIRDMVQ